MTTLRNFYSFLTREGEIAAGPDRVSDPAASSGPHLPKYLNREEIEQLVGGSAAGQTDRDRGIGRCCELLYATGLRVTELCRLELNAVERDSGVLRVTGKGNKQRLVPFGESAGEAIDRYLGQGRPRLLKGRASRFLFVTAQRVRR